MTDADDLVDHLDGVGVLGVKTRDEGIGLARLHHHHAEVVTLEHLVVSLLEGVAVALAFLSQDAGIALTTLLFAGMAQVDNLDALQVEVELLGHLLDHLVVTQQNGLTDAFGLSLHGSLEHGGVNGLGKHHALRVCRCCGVELLGEFRLLSQQYAQRVLVFFPVSNILTGHATVNGSLCHSGAHLGDESWVNRLRNEVVASEGQVVYLIDIVHHVGNRLFGQVGNSHDGSHLHLLVDGLSVNVECSTEDVWEADNVVNLVGIVGAAC